jgi:chromosome segregation ATPase
LQVIVYYEHSFFCNTLANYSGKNGLTWFDSYKSQAYEITDEINKAFSDIKGLSPDLFKKYNMDGWEPFIKNTGVADETLTKFLTDANQTDKSLEAFKQYPDVVSKTGKAFNFAALGAKAFNMALNAAIMFTVVKVFELAAKAIDDYVHRLDRAKEAFANTESDLSSVRSEIETTTDKIKELQSLDKISITEEEDLQRLKDQNEELRIRLQYLEKQKQLEADKVAKYTKEKYNYEYGDAEIQEDIDSYRKSYGGIGITPQSKALANLIAQYQYYQEEKAKAVSNEDQVSLDKWDTKIKETTLNLMDSRETLQGWSDDLSATGESSEELDGVKERLKLIDDLLLTPGQNLVNFIDSDALKKNKEKLVDLADSGKLTAQVLSTKFADVDAYLKENGLTLEDLISVVKTYKDELVTTGEETKKTFSKEDVIANINSLSGGFESLDKIMNSMKGKNPFDYSLLNDKNFTDEFKGMGKAYTDFIETVSSSPKDVNAAKSAFDNLVTTWIDNKGVLSDLTEENSGLASAMLKNMGIANAEEVVAARLRKEHEDLAAQKYYDANASNDLENATMTGIAAFVDEAVAAGVSQQAMAELALEKISVNDIKIDTASDIDQVIALANAAGASTSALEQLARAKSAFESINSAIAKSTAQLANPSIGSPIAAGLTMATELLNSNTLQEISEAQKTFEGIKNGTFDYQFTLDPNEYKKAVYNGGTKTNKPSGSGSKDKKDTSKDIDWIDRQLKLLKDKRSELVNEISDTYSAFSTATHDQILELDKTLIDEYANAINQYQQEYDKAASKISDQNKAKIENGSMSVDTLSGTELENVQSAMDAYDKLASTQKDQSEAQKTHLDDIKSKYDAVSKSIENENNKLKDSNSILESQMEYYNSKGIVIDSSFYNRLIQNTSGLISNARDTISNKRAELRDLLANGADTSSQEYLDLKSEIADAESNVYALKKAQEEYNNKLLQIPIENASILVSMYQDIGNAIQGWGDDVVASGGKLDANYYQSLISNGATVIGQLQKQSSLIKDVMDNYEVGSDNWNDLYKQLQSVNSEMSSAIQNIRKFNEELLKMPLENIGNFSSELQKVADGQSKVQSEQDQVISAVTGAIKEQIDLLNEQKDAINEQKTAEIDALKEKLKLLEKSNEERRLQFDLEQRQYDLERAKNQNINHVIRNGELVYEADAKAVSDAQQALLDSQYNLEKYNLQEQIDKAQESLDLYNYGLQEQIDALQKISDKWSEISEKITQAQNEAKADETLGTGWKDKVMSGNDTALFNTLSGMYANTAEQLKKYQDQIDSTNNIQSLLEDYVASYKAGEITYAEAVNGINGLLSQLNQKMSATDNLQNIFDYLGTVNDTAANADAILTGIQSGLKDTATELLKSLEQYNKNAGMISEYTSSWQQLTNNVKSMLDVLKEVRDNLKDNYDRDDDDNDNTRYGGGKDGSPGTPGKGDYVNSGPGVYADGIRNGLVGSSSDSEREKMIKYLSTNELKSGEVPIIAHEGEAILNHSQQDQYLKNFINAANFAPTLPDYSNILKNIKISDRSTAPTITFNGGINIQECNKANDLANEILNGGLTRAVIQGLGKR